MFESISGGGGVGNLTGAAFPIWIWSAIDLHPGLFWTTSETVLAHKVAPSADFLSRLLKFVS